MVTPTTLTDSITERSITYTLASPAPVGQFVTGDYFAVGGVVASIDPPSEQYDGLYEGGEAYSDRWINGAMVDAGKVVGGKTGANPTDTPQGWDNLPPSPGYLAGPPAKGPPTELAYSHALNKDPGATGLSISGPCSIFKARSVTSNPNISSRQKLVSGSLLTLLDAIPPAGSFRRWSGCADKTPIFFASDVDWSVLPSVAKPAGAPTLVAGDLIAKLGPLHTVGSNNLFIRGTAPTDLQSAYGGDIANDVLRAMLFTMTTGVSTADRDAVGHMLIQAGLDICDAIEAGRRWSSNTYSFGGGHQWLKILVVYAARLLRNATNVVERDKLVARANGVSNRIFGNDMTVFPITRERIEGAGAKTIANRITPSGWPEYSENSIGYSAKPSNYVDGGVEYEVAYQTTNCLPYITTALVARMMGAEDLWNYPNYFEWCDTFYNRWLRRNFLADAYMQSYCREFCQTYYATYAPAYLDTTTAPAVVRREARGRYVWIEFDRPLDLQKQPAPATVTVTVDGSPVSLGSLSKTASGVKTVLNANTNTTAPVITVTDATGVRVGQRVTSAYLPNDIFVRSVSGNTIGITGHIPAAFTAQSVTFHDTFVWLRSLVAILPTPLTNQGQKVTIDYADPGGGDSVRSLGGVAASTLPFATNRTGQYPDGPTGKANAYSGPTKATRQHSGTEALRTQSYRRIRASLRFMLTAALATDEVLLASSTGSSGTLKLWAVSGTDLRIFVGNQTIRAPGALTGLPLNTLITMHFYVDLTKTTQTTAKKLAIVWSGGGNPDINMSGSTGTLDGLGVGDIATTLSGGLYTHASAGGLNAFPGSIQEITIGWGDDTYALPADLTGAQFAATAAWGDNGELPWGINQLYYAGTIVEWNGSVPNRGYGYGALALSPLRYVDPTSDESGLLTFYEEHPV